MVSPDARFTGQNHVTVAYCLLEGSSPRYGGRYEAEDKGGTMLFSHQFGITPSVDDDWFDPVLTLDTPLFVDPFLIYDNEFGLFTGSHHEIIDFFNGLFGLIAESHGLTYMQGYRRALHYLELPEVDELCIGYTSKGTKGSGSGLELATVMASAMWEAITHGMDHITHFEEIALLREGIGADRISDTTAGILRWRLAQYTEGICKKHGVPLQSKGYVRGRYDPNAQRWVSTITSLPVNPSNGRPILLVPRVYLRNLPTINADDFWDYCVSSENAVLRHEFGRDVLKRVSKQDIVSLARTHPEIRKRYIEHTEEGGSKPYDLNKDYKGIVQPYREATEYARSHPFSMNIGEQGDFIGAIDAMVLEYQHFVEEGGGWRLLWNDNKSPRSEESAQLLLKGIVSSHCQTNDIDLSREADVGRGPVDFRVSHGYRLRALLEVKLASNTRFWHGIQEQLPTYMTSDRVDYGYFIVVVHSDNDIKRMKEINQITEAVNERTEYCIKSVVVDARAKVSASRYRRI